MERNPSEAMCWLTRIKMALRLVCNAGFAGHVRAGLDALAAAQVKPAPLPPERAHASALALLASLQREGRLVDFLEQEVGGFSDADVGAAARVVHTGCRKVLRQYFTFEPAVQETEGEPVTVPAGFEAQRIRLAGNVSGQPPFKGTLKHHGWVAASVRLPALSAALDPRVVAPAEVELS